MNQHSFKFTGYLVNSAPSEYLVIYLRTLPKQTETIKQRIVEKIQDNFSPEQVVRMLNEEGVIKLHHESIYQFVLNDKKSGGMLCTHLLAAPEKEIP